MVKKGKHKSRMLDSTARVTVYVPSVVWEKVVEQAEAEGISRSWITTEALLQYLNMDEEEIIKQRGYEIPSKFEDRKGEWTPKKKKKSK